MNLRKKLGNKNFHRWHRACLPWQWYPKEWRFVFITWHIIDCSSVLILFQCLIDFFIMLLPRGLRHCNLAFLCLLRSQLDRNVFEQMSQRKFFSTIPLWNLFTCNFTSQVLKNVFGHNSHLKSRRFSWTLLMWSLRWFLHGKNLAQTSHWNFVPFSSFLGSCLTDGRLSSKSSSSIFSVFNDCMQRLWTFFASSTSGLTCRTFKSSLTDSSVSRFSLYFVSSSKSEQDCRLAVP